MQIEINTESGISRIIIDERFRELGKFIPAENVVIITDGEVFKFYKDDFPPFPVIKIGTGEEIKNLKTVNSVYDQLVKGNADRSTFLMGIGGGVVCDITGFVASTFMRGLRFGYVSTTLLSQVDASIGGKTGVNFQGFKNIIGTFRQPEFVFCDPCMLDTLPHREFKSGLAEIVKHSMIQDNELFRALNPEIFILQLLGAHRYLIISLPTVKQFFDKQIYYQILEGHQTELKQFVYERLIKK